MTQLSEIGTKPITGKYWPAGVARSFNVQKKRLNITVVGKLICFFLKHKSTLQEKNVFVYVRGLFQYM
jgi:hypothetical protein